MVCSVCRFFRGGPTKQDLNKPETMGMEGNDMKKPGAGVEDIGIRASIRQHVDKKVLYAKQRAHNVAGKTRDRAQTAYVIAKRTIYNALATILTFILIFSLSLFLYGTFYYAYMPLQVHEEPLYLQFEACADSTGPCSFPNATAQLNNKIRLMTGQPYSISLQLEVPDSSNNQALGMFMSCLHITKLTGKNPSLSCRSAILEFRSGILRFIETIFFSPFLVSGTTTQRQWININYYRRYMDDLNNPATEAVLEIKSRFIQVYTAKLLIHAEFSGLRHVMYNYPMISTIVGVCTNFIMISVIILISWSRFFADESKLFQFDSGLVGEIQEDKDDIEILKPPTSEESELKHPHDD